MKGIVFTEFLDLVRSEFGEDMVDHIITESNLPTGGAYTAVGTYDHDELATLVSKLSDATKQTVPDLLRAYGIYLFERFTVKYPQFFRHAGNSFDFLSMVEGHIHVEVKKLYPDAELPSIQCDRLSENVLRLTYRSNRPFAAFAEGMMRGAVAYFAQNMSVELKASTPDGKMACFELVRQ